MRGQGGDADGFGPGGRDQMIVFHRTAADANGPDQYAVGIDDRHAAGKSDQAAIGMLDAIERTAGLRQGAEKEYMEVEGAAADERCTTTLA